MNKRTLNLRYDYFDNDIQFSKKQQKLTFQRVKINGLNSSKTNITSRILNASCAKLVIDSGLSAGGTTDVPIF